MIKKTIIKIIQKDWGIVRAIFLRYRALQVDKNITTVTTATQSRWKLAKTRYRPNWAITAKLQQTEGSIKLFRDVGGC